MRQDSADRRRLQRIEELRADLNHKLPTRSAYARQTLLTMLWLGDDNSRQQIINVVCRDLPEERQEAPEFAVRLCAYLCREAEANAAAPSGMHRINGPGRINGSARIDAPDHIDAIFGAALASILTPAVQQLKLEMEGDRTNDEDLYRATDLCRDALTMATCFAVETVVDPAVRLLRLFPPDQARGTGPLARQTGPLREAASFLLGSLSPDKLYGYWYALGSPEHTARRDLLPVLDYLHDARATPYLVRLFERRGQWGDGEMVGWFAVRAFKRIRDRRALPALRRVVNMEKSLMLVNPNSQASPDLIREARRAIEAIEYGRSSSERGQLLRASQPPVDQLLQPAQAGMGDDLVRPSQREESDLIRPADPESDQLVRPANAPADQLLRPTQSPEQRAQDREQLLRWTTDPENPFENFDPQASF